ncbi:MAG: NUDIX hydrolase [Beijerinckiaceae bacterium]
MSQLLRKRPTARLFVFDPTNRLLLIRYRTTPPVSPPYSHVKSLWFTPGGGLEKGETAREAAARELMEETGLDLPIGPEVAWREEDVTFFQKKVCVVERYFVVRAATSYVNTQFLADTEDDDVEEVGWWSMTELRQLKDHIDPPGLAALAERLARGDFPAEPVNLGSD